MSKQIIFTGAALDVMWALYNRGPMSIEDVPSKSGLDDLLRHKLATPIIDQGKTKFAGTLEMISYYKRQTWKTSTKL